MEYFPRAPMKSQSYYIAAIDEAKIDDFLTREINNIIKFILKSPVAKVASARIAPGEGPYPASEVVVDLESIFQVCCISLFLLHALTTLSPFT